MQVWHLACHTSVFIRETSSEFEVSVFALTRDSKPGYCTGEAPFDVSGQTPNAEERVLDQRILRSLVGKKQGLSRAKHVLSGVDGTPSPKV